MTFPKHTFFYLFLASLAILQGCREQDTSKEAYSATDYSDNASWVYLEIATGGKTADVFLVCPTAHIGGKDLPYNMDLDDTEIKKDFTGALNMERGIYDGDARMFAPFYRQVSLAAYELSEKEAEEYFAAAYSDVKSAFLYYFDRYNSGRPFVLAGFSQGADMLLRLMRDLFGDGKYSESFIAAYAIGWRLTEEDTCAYPQIKAAQTADDVGVVISFNTEAESVTTSVVIPDKTLGINPLSWKTTGEKADKSLNRGACFTDYSGAIVREIPALTGAYLHPDRGTLKVTDIIPEEYPSELFAEGVYHMYDYQFFYRNLQENVRVRINAFVENGKTAAN
ncbi:MAG: DUF3089 domain-containing protein [Prevotellaceae bacterium]|jgi:hypothetical protein|nr:DUF3089 domain-containing protein [Prevotellaceae bacterium]